ncbi:MAG: hypothetical protein EBR34_16525, partial [Sphingomonadaceae bacterium]|nr:hypothetical protein [Sphingomonadaceae bacterium]
MEAAPAPEAAVADSAPELSVREIIEQASQGRTAEEITGGTAPERARDASGRFAAKDAEPGETAAEEVSTDQPTPPAEEPETPAIQPPQAWSGPEKEVFASLPPAAQEAILRRERDVDRA